MTDRDTIIRLAREAGLTTVGAFFDEKAQFVGDFDPSWERFAELVIADFLQRTGQYVTNDATRAAVVAEAVAAEREACAKACEALAEGEEFDAYPRNGFLLGPKDGCDECATAIRARGAATTEGENSV